MSEIASKETDERYTPANILNAAERVFCELRGWGAAARIDCDPFSCRDAQSLVGAVAYGEIGRPLPQPWHGFVWVNPPYSRKAIGPAIDLVLSNPLGVDTHMLVFVNVMTTSAWWKRLADRCEAVHFLPKRLEFLGEGLMPVGGGNWYSQALWYIGSKPCTFGVAAERRFKGRSYFLSVPHGEQT